MNARTAVWSATLGFAILISVVWTAQSSPSAESANRWEHLAMTVDAIDSPGDAEASRKIVQLGEEGWELVDVESLTKDGTTTKLIYYFKRPK